MGLRGGILRAAIVLVALLTSVASFGGQEDMVVTAERQVPLLLKILTYDRRLDRVGQHLVIGVVRSPTSSASARACEAVTNILQTYLGKTVKQIPLDYQWADYAGPEKLLSWAKAKKISVFYLAPGNEKNLAAILKVGQENGISSMTGVPAYVERGVAVGIGERQAKPQILINLESSRREGSEFDASLLRVATIVK